MSPSTSTRLERVTETLPANPEHRLTTTVQALGFWMAVALPVLYVPLLWQGLSGETVVPFVGLLVANAVSLVIGHDHGRE